MSNYCNCESCRCAPDLSTLSSRVSNAARAYFDAIHPNLPIIKLVAERTTQKSTIPGFVLRVQSRPIAEFTKALAGPSLYTWGLSLNTHQLGRECTDNSAGLCALTEGFEGIQIRRGFLAAVDLANEIEIRDYADYHLTKSWFNELSAGCKFAIRSITTFALAESRGELRRDLALRRKVSRVFGEGRIAPYLEA